MKKCIDCKHCYLGSNAIFYCSAGEFTTSINGSDFIGHNPEVYLNKYSDNGFYVSCETMRQNDAFCGTEANLFKEKKSFLKFFKGLFS